MKTSAIFFTSALILLFATASAQKCSCKMPTSALIGLETETTPMMKATAKRWLKVKNSPYNWIVFEHEAQFRGCKPTTKKFIVKTPKSAKTCGVKFYSGKTYLITVTSAGSSTPPPTIAAYAVDVYSAVSCNYNKLWADVPYKTKTTLYDTPIKYC